MNNPRNFNRIRNAPIITMVFVLLSTALLFALAFAVRTSRSGDTALSSVVGVLEAGRFDEVTSLIKANPKVLHSVDDNGRSLLHIASSRKDANFVRFLIAEGSDLELRDKSGRSPLFVAAHAGAKGCTSALIEAGANVNARNMIDMTPLQAAALAGDLPMVKLLVKNGAETNATMATGQTPLNLASECRYSRVAGFLRSATAQR